MGVRPYGTAFPTMRCLCIFDRFWRGQGTVHTSGSGIGLTVTADLARARGGELTAASTEGRGTTMMLRLPHLGDAVRAWAYVIGSRACPAARAPALG
jgi:signal transduction histidine kinase